MRGRRGKFHWETQRDKSIEFHDEPNKKCYQFMVTHPDRPNWGFRDCWTCTNGDYEGTNNTHTDTTQRGMAAYVVDNFAKRSFEV
jgi:hypothetical protein